MKNYPNKFIFLIEHGKYLLLIFLFTFSIHFTYGLVHEINSKSTITVIELNDGDEVKFNLQTGRIVHLKLINNQTEIVFSTTSLPGQGRSTDASVFKMRCMVNIDGQDLEMIRYVPVQESFYEPYYVNGLRIWFDALKSLDQFYNENHGTCLPKKQVRLALHDATLPICPEEITKWCNLPENYPDVKLCYRGEDTWLGTYFGTDLHGGLDINMPSNAPLWAPVSFDYNYTFNSLKSGHNNNRWRALKHWENGDSWIIQTHHHNELIVPEFNEIKKGTKYAYTAGTLSGAVPHTHFVFRVKQPDFDEFYMDPWVIFWQILENNKVKANALHAIMQPVKPGKTGALIKFDGTKSCFGLSAATPEFYWSFGDGGFSVSQTPVHIFQKSGIYPVTLTIFDGMKHSSITQHITINGNSTALPEFKAFQEDNFSFIPRQPWEMDSYNHSKMMLPNTVNFSLPHYTKEDIKPQKITLKLINTENLAWEKYAPRIEVNYVHGNSWLDLKLENTTKNDSMIIHIIPKIAYLNSQEGKSEAYLVIHDNGFINSPYLIKVEINFYRPENTSNIIIDDQDPNCVKSNYFWLTNKINPELNMKWSQCFGESFLLNSDNSENGFIRYLPTLQAGKYRVSLHSPLYSQEIILSKMEGFYVHINSKDGIETKWINPGESTVIGEFHFNSCDGYVEITSKNSKGLIFADAIMFERIE
jgi:PKD repeat protein